MEADVEAYGFLASDDDELLARVMERRWAEAFPVITEPLQVTWEPGESLVKPNIFRHNLLRDLAVDGVALRALDAAVDGGLKPYARLLVDGTEFSVVQATKVLDVVDVGSSIPPDYSWQEFAFPHMPPLHDPMTDRQFFRVPNRGWDLSVFMGNSVKHACDQAGLTGLLYCEAVVPPDEWELGLP
ncbi:hypothetical protein EAS64_30730 [Trebonia kvetii]|uniref:Uncharacterized protein n=1 Tax=Trebonia kvetii TaxID=2480626 RepID=A0A6P2BXC0_9ACTN|nr:hypothetical protein [Trebonia kvetii]TVZ01823.1 hypothetical protein EAS64_30730 [Trebonia kvetii]